MTTPIKLAVYGIPVVDIWARVEKKWLMFKYHCIVSDLYDFVDGQQYVIEVSEPCILKWNKHEWPLKAGENTIIWQDKPEYITAQILNLEWASWVDFTLERLGLDRLLSVAGIWKIEVLSPEAFAAKYPFATGSGDEAEGVITFKDFPWIPASATIAAVVHEAWHRMQIKFGIFNGQNKNEWQAYAMTALLHLMYGEDLNVFNTSAYPSVPAMVASPWP